MRDRVRGVERRLTMAPVSTVSRIAGSFVFMTTGLFVILVLLMLVGVVVFGITLHHPLTLALLAAGFSVFASALHMAIISASRNERSASFLGSGLIMMLSLLGGTFFPADVMPPFLRRVAFVMPNGAAQQGFIDVLAQGRTLADVSARIVTTWGWALAMLALAVLFARRREGRA
jgi:ABC-2 type transport system permease protein